MKPGRELDALIAEKVMGLTVERWEHFCAVSASGPGSVRIYDGEKCIHAFSTGSQPIKPYSTSIEAAWDVVEWMRYNSGHGYLLSLSRNGNDTWLAEFAEPTHSATGETATHAVCLAALKAVGAI